MSRMSARPARPVRQALAQVSARWSSERTQRTLASLPSRGRERRRRRQVALGAAVLALACLGLAARTLLWPNPGPLALLPHGDRTPLETAALGSGSAASAEQGPRTLELEDGSTVTLLTPETRVAMGTSEPGERGLVLATGRAEFDVTHRPGRTFTVTAGGVMVTVLGTRFEVDRRSQDVRVSVTRGRVAVTWDGGRRLLAAGESDLFPDARGLTELPAAATEREAIEPMAAKLGSAAPDTTRTPARLDANRPRARAGQAGQAARATWREHAERGEFKRAYALLTDGRAGVRGRAKDAASVEDLLLAADAARLSGHPRAALPYLRQVIDGHPNDARAPLAAFTLGGVLMNQLGLPREAEAAYEKARAMTRSPALAQDALARQVEAAHRAGDGPLARTLAEQYVARYPDGRRLEAVRRFGQLP